MLNSTRMSQCKDNKADGEKRGRVPSIPILAPAVDESGSLERILALLHFRMRDTHGKRYEARRRTSEVLTVGNRATQIEADREAAGHGWSGEGPRLSLAAPRCDDRSGNSCVGDGLRRYLRT